MFRYINCFFIGILLGIAPQSFALPSIEVYPLKTQTGTSYHHKGGNLQQSLIQTPGIFVDSTGAMGQMAFPMVRGMQGRYAITLVDGIPFDEGASRAPDLSKMDALGLDHMTILYGPEVLLYSGHGVGVIDLKTKNESQKTMVDVKAGSFKTVQTSMKATVRQDRARHIILTNHRQTAGFPQYSDTRVYGERNRYTGENVGVLSTFALGDQTTLETHVRKIESLLKYDQGNPALSSKPQGTQETGDLLLGATLNHETDRGGYHQLHLSHKGQKTRYETNVPTIGHQTQVQYRQDVPWSSGQRTQLVVEGVGDTLKQKTQFETHRTTVAAAFLHSLYLDQHWQVDTGLRQEHTKKYAQNPLGTVGVSWLKNSTRLYGSWRQGCRVPTLYDIHGKSPFFEPNSTLKSEHIDFWELGWAQRFRPKGQIQVAYFQSQTKNKIVTVPLDPGRSTVQNLSHTETAKGIEVSIHYPCLKNIMLKGAYTYTRGAKGSPTHQGSFVIAKKMNSWQLESTVSYTGCRHDWSQKHLPAYVVQNVTITYTLTGQWRIYSEIKNLWDERYEVISTYRSPRRAVYVGTCINI